MQNHGEAVHGAHVHLQVLQQGFLPECHLHQGVTAWLSVRSRGLPAEPGVVVESAGKHETGSPLPSRSPLTLRGSQPRNEARKLELLERSHMTLTLGGKLAPIHPETATATATKSRLSPWAREAHQAGSSRFRRPSTSPGDTDSYMASSPGGPGRESWSV